MNDDGLSVAIQVNTDTDVTPGVLMTDRHPEGCTCGHDADINLILAGGITLRQVLDMAEKVVQGLKEHTIEDPITGELFAR